MSNYFCPECGYQGEEEMCPHCSIPAEPLELPDDPLTQTAGKKFDTYSKDLVNKNSEVSLDDVVAEEDYQNRKNH